MPLKMSQAQFVMIMKRYSLSPYMMERVFGFVSELLEAEADALGGAAHTDDRFCSLMSAAREVANLSDSYFDLLRRPPRERLTGFLRQKGVDLLENACSCSP